MPQKTTKKPAAKKVAKKAPAKKSVKQVVKPAVAPKAVVSQIPLPDPYCHCTKRKRNCILTCVFTCSFLLGMLVYHMFFCDGHHVRFKPSLQFENGCLNVQSVKCPKLLEELPAIDINQDGCVTREEMRAAKKAARHGAPRPEQFPEAPFEE